MGHRRMGDPVPARAGAGGGASAADRSACTTTVIAIASVALGLAEAGVIRLSGLLWYRDLALVAVAVGLWAWSLGAWGAARWPLPTAWLAWLLGASALAAAWALPASDWAWAAGMFAWPFAMHGALLHRAMADAPDAAARRGRLVADAAGLLFGLVLLPIALLPQGGPAVCLLVAALVAAVAAGVAVWGGGAGGTRGRLVTGWILGLDRSLVVATIALVATALTSLPHAAVVLPSPVGVARHLDAAVARYGLRAIHSVETTHARTDLVLPETGAGALVFTDAMHVARAPRWDGASARFDDPATEALVGLRRAALAPCRDGRVVILGAGAGFDVAVALQAGAAAVDAVERDAAIPALLRVWTPTLTAALDHPRARWHMAEGRAWVERARASQERWDCAMLALIETAPAAARARTAPDGWLLTRQALTALRAVVAPGGVIAIVHNEGALAAGAHATLAAIFGDAAVISLHQPASATASPARWLTVASVDPSRRAAVVAAAATVEGVVGGVLAGPSLDDDRPWLRPPQAPGVLATSLALLWLAASALLVRRSGQGRGAPAGSSRRRGAALAAGLAAGLAQGAAVAWAGAVIPPAWGGTGLALAGALIGGIAGISLPSAWRRRTAVLTAICAAAAALVGAAPALGALWPLSPMIATAVALWLAAAWALPAGAAWAACVEGVPPNDRPEQPQQGPAAAADGLGAILAADGLGYMSALAAWALLPGVIGLGALLAAGLAAAAAALALASPAR